MTLRKAKSIARHLRLTLRQVCSGDYRVNFRDGNETTAYYTDSLEDAINTAVGMARRREAAPYRVGDVIWHLPSRPKPSQSRSPPDDFSHATHIGSDEQIFGTVRHDGQSD